MEKENISKEQVYEYLKIIESTIPIIFKLLYLNYSIDNLKLLIYTATTDIKYSFHIIIKGYRFCNYSETRNFFKKCSSYILDTYGFDVPFDFLFINLGNYSVLLIY